MRLKELTLSGFKSFSKKTSLIFDAPITAIVGPNGSGKSNIAEAFRWVLGEQSLKSLRGRRGEDFIWSGHGGKINRALVGLTLDNQDRKFQIDFPELVISREVYRDGANTYSVNDSEVRLRDLFELLAQASLGASGHHIIRQGEADRVLNADPAARRSLVEDALGLRLYQWKIEESEKKMTKTEENIKQVESLRREIAPHLKFLTREVEKIRKTDELRATLKRLYLVYLKIENEYLKYSRQELTQEKTKLENEGKNLEIKLRNLQSAFNPSDEVLGKLRAVLAELMNKLRVCRERLADSERQLGRLEGRIQFKSETATAPVSPSEILPRDQVLTLTKEIEKLLEESAWVKIKDLIRSFWMRIDQREQAIKNDNQEEELAKLKVAQAGLEETVKEIKSQEEELLEKEKKINKEIEDTLLASRTTDRQTYELRAHQSAWESQQALWRARNEKLVLEERAFAEELREGSALVDREILDYKNLAPADLPDGQDRAAQLEKKKALEKLKIRLEDLGVNSSEVLKEHQETVARDEFLAKELADLLVAREELAKVMSALRERINEEFRTGIKEINHHFQNFFSLMFGGGEASLNSVNAAPETLDEAASPGGLEIKVNLPRKKIRGLEMLSGGERALTSIALLFALSQVNPPPFLILDETDAALDEANSRKYGDMIENLSQHSQLILITHNRETMSRAQVIYGVTMGADGVSRLLSIKFDDAVAYAK